MMSSGSSTERGSPSRETGLQPWHFYMLLSLGAATWAVIVSRHTHPAALLLISAAIMAAGLVAAALHSALTGFFGGGVEGLAPSGRTREFLERDKALVLRSIKELEFDHSMRKVSDRDFAEMSGRLRQRAMEIMQELERGPGPASAASGKAEAPTAPSTPGTAARAARPIVPGPCAACGTPNDSDARFCKSCGARL